jgi:hypothetical protein
MAAVTRAPTVGRIGHEPSSSQVPERIGTIHGSEARDPLPAHRHDDLPATGDMPDVSAQLIVKLTNTHLMLQLPM